VSIVTALNQKGGVGKTSTCHHLAGTLAGMGRRVLLLDNDPQASLTQGFWGPVATSALDPAQTIAALYAGDAPFPEQVIRPTGIPGVDIVAGSKRVTDFNVPRPHEVDPEVQGCLRSFLDEARDGYDLVLIDCPPNLHLCSWAALAASSHLLVPLQAEDYGAQGLGPVQEAVDAVTSGPNPKLELLGFLVTMFNARFSIHKLYDQLLREQYGHAVFETRYKPRSASAKAIRALADELLARLSVAPCITAPVQPAQEAA
jgi:chromosome partitioning protein